MPWTRQLPSGLWASTVRTPAGRITKTHRLKSVVENWAADIEADVRHDEFIDPRKAEITVGEWYERCRAGVRREKASRKRDESHWRCHVEPRWAHVRLAQILKPDVSAWVVAMEAAHRDDCAAPKRCPGCKVGAATIEGAVGVLRGLIDQAIDAGILRSNPARGVRKPPRAVHVDRVLDADEERLLLDRLTALFGDRADGQLFVELLLDCGLRWEEAAAVPPELVDTKRQRIAVAWVMERDGTCRPYAKSEAGNRTVGYGDHLAARMAAAKLAAKTVSGVFPAAKRGQVAPTRLVFTSPGGGGRARRKAGEPGPLRYSNWYRDVWRPALAVQVPDLRACEKPPGTSGPKPKATRPERYLDDPQPTPHDLRHTFGTRLADQGVPVHDIMSLMGHADIRSAQRYLHSRDERFARARDALNRAAGRPVSPVRSADHDESPMSQGHGTTRHDVAQRDTRRPRSTAG